MENHKEKDQPSQGKDMDSLQMNPPVCLEVESQLQSLGFIMNNGRPRFKLGDDTPACLNTTVADINDTDGEDTLSFVVLGKDSLDSIQASTLASYVNIQQKSMSIDYNSIISSLNPNDVHQKLNTLLQENNQLKETLKLNNTAMKQQFNTLATWQEGLMKVHQNHKKKFAETKELINYLKKENAELKMKISLDFIDQSELLDINESMQIKQIDIPAKEQSDVPTSVDEDSSNANSKIDFTDFEELLNMLKEEGEESKMLFNTNDNNHPDVASKVTHTIEVKDKTSEIKNSIPEAELPKKISSLADDLTSQQKCINSNPEVERSISPINSIRTQTSAFVEIQSNESSYVRPRILQNVNSCSLCEGCGMKDKEIYSLKKSIAGLEDKLQQAAASIPYCTKNPLIPNESQRQCCFNVKQHNETIEKVTECFDKPIKINKDDIVGQTGLFGDTQSWVVGRVVPERLLNLKLNSVLSELEEMQKHNPKDSVAKCSVSSESYLKATEFEKQKYTDLMSLEEERKILAEERNRLKEEMKLVNIQKETLDKEYKSLNDAKELFQQERISLDEEKASLDQQSQLYDDQKLTLKREIADIYILREKVEKKDLSIKELQKQLKNCEEINNLLQMQLKIYEEDFKQERTIKESLLEEKNKFDAHVQKQVDYNKQLQNEISRLKVSINGDSSQRQASNFELIPPLAQTYPCPKCQCSFTSMETLEHHLNFCLD